MIGFDTNILVYATLRGSDPKIVRAQDLIERAIRQSAGALMLQNLGEFSHVAIRKSGMHPDEVGETLDAWRSTLHVHAAVEGDLRAALATVRDHHLQFWDAMLCATAARVGVKYLLTEDMQDRRLLDGVRLVNPFHRRNDDLIDRILPA